MFISATEYIADTPEGIILEGMLESMAEYYSANLSKHVKRGMRETVLNGNWTGGNAPYGYRIENKRLVVDEESAATVRFIFEQYALGASKTEIVRMLDEKGFKTAAGRSLNYNYIHKILTNKRYIGIVTYADMVVEIGSPAIVDEDLFKRVQTKLAARKRAPAASKAKVEYLLQGKAFCGLCGANMVGESGRGRRGTVYHYYACADKKKLHTCNKHNEKKGFLEWYIVEHTVLYVLAPERIEIIAERIVDEYNKEFNADKELEYERQILRYDREINTAVDASLEAHSKVRQKLFEKIELLETKKEDAEIELARLKVANGIRYTKDEVKAWMKQFCNGDPLDPDFQHRIIDVFISSVYVFDDKLAIYYNIKDGVQISYMEMQECTEGIFDDGYEAECSNYDTLAVP